jgi:acetyl-CoA carboxylase carboxyl transferase subunit beta
MSITDWFSAREKRLYTESVDNAGGADVPDGVWIRCDECKHIAYRGELVESAWTCPKCGDHFDVSAHQRVALLVDDGSFAETNGTMTSVDPLCFEAVKTYTESLDRARQACDLAEAIVTGTATILGRPVVVGAMDFKFIGASMGSVVGEKITAAFELATAQRMPLVLVTASGGARMQEGMLSLMQMAKTSAAARRHSDARLPYVSLLTNPTYGGVTASFAVLADVILAEPGAIIGFTGPRVIEQTIRAKLPKGFQSSEFLLEHGMIDAVVPRPELRDKVALLLAYLGDGEFSAPEPGDVESAASAPIAPGEVG